MIVALGWIGTVLIVGAYAAASWFGVDPQGVAYQATNVIGAALLGVQLHTSRVWSAFGLQCVWCAIGIIALLRLFIIS